MNTKPNIVKEIEKLLGKGIELHPAPVQPTLLDGLMAIKTNQPKFALDEGRLIGLNLAGTDLTDDKWKAVLALPGFHPEHLQALNLDGNQLTKLLLPSGMKELLMLTISKNKLTEFALPEGMDGLKAIDLEDNPLENPPPEIVKQGGAAVLAWLNSFKKEKGKPVHFLREIKVLLVGEGTSGKTSLLKKIKGLDFNENESQTHGVNVEVLDLGKLEMFKEFVDIQGVKARLWDFGGQEIMHSSHQFFLSHRSIYLLLLNSRNDAKKEYWLRHISKFGGGSPCIVVINKIDESPGYDVARNTLNKDFPFIENRFCRISCRTGEKMVQFAEMLAMLIPQTELFNTTISESWLAVKNQLEEETSANRYINEHRFVEICRAHGVHEKVAQKTLLKYLDDLGIVLHFPDLSLESFYVLDPHWVTIGVYKIINSPSIKAGLLHQGDLDYILNTEEQKKEEYDPNREKPVQYKGYEKLYLVNIMEEFELLYEYRKGQWLVPDLLPQELSESLDFDGDEAVEFIMDYDFLPPNVISRFIVKMKDDLQDSKFAWRTGVVLNHRKYNCKAMVTADLDKQRIRISVCGNDTRKRDYFSVIYHTLWSINNSFKDLVITEKMPVPGHPEREVDYEDLLGYEEDGIDEYRIGSLKKNFSVSRDFLNKISAKGERQRREIHVHVHDAPEGMERQLGNMDKGIRSIQQKQEKQHEEIKEGFVKVLNKLEEFNLDAEDLRSDIRQCRGEHVDPGKLENNFDEIKNLLNQLAQSPELKKIPELATKLEAWKNEPSRKSIKVVGTLFPTIIQEVLPLIPNIQYEYEVDENLGFIKLVKDMVSSFKKVCFNPKKNDNENA